MDGKFHYGHDFYTPDQTRTKLWRIVCGPRLDISCPNLMLTPLHWLFAVLQLLSHGFAAEAVRIPGGHVVPRACITELTNKGALNLTAANGPPPGCKVADISAASPSVQIYAGGFSPTANLLSAPLTTLHYQARHGVHASLVSQLTST